MAPFYLITSMFALFIPFLANVTYGDVRSNLRGSNGGYGGRYSGRRDNEDQFNRVDMLRSHIGGPMTIKSINNHIGITRTTEQPTEMPTEMRTEQPTEAPTEGPKEQPTEMPTGIDATTAAPTEIPTALPTTIPGQPTIVPTTAIPTETPTSIPTKTPTTAIPTTIPSDTPTTVNPSEAPSAVPTEMPSAVPTEMPTITPSEMPSAVPTEEPTNSPSEMPSAVPTEVPTITPSETPSAVPTEMPTEMPTETPTETPTVMPSEMPTVQPNKQPTEQPTEMPSEMPTEIPTTETPTAIPTAIPTTALPTEIPTTVMPTFTPSGNASCGCSDIATVVVELVSPITNRTWMDRNLGASRRATDFDDLFAYGCQFQWGRGLDGAASMKWTGSSSGTGVTGTTGGPVSVPFPACNDTEQFVTYSTTQDPPLDWLSPQNDTLWETGSNRDPCPKGYQVPSVSEWTAEYAEIANGNEAYTKLGLTGAGKRTESGFSVQAGFESYYWSRTPVDFYFNYAFYFLVEDLGSAVLSSNRVFGYSVRCINKL